MQSYIIFHLVIINLIFKIKIESQIFEFLYILS